MSALPESGAAVKALPQRKKELFAFLCDELARVVAKREATAWIEACDRTRGAMQWLDSRDRASVRTLALQLIRSDRGMRRQIAAERKAAA